MREIFLDNNATTMSLPEVRSAVASVLCEGFGNASSANSSGRRAQDSISEARASVANLIAAEESSIVFTSGGTEANNLVLLSAAASNGERTRIVTASTEHSSILKTVDHLVTQNVEVVVLPVDSTGRVNLNRAAQEITSDTSLVSIQWANNETGVIQPVKELSDICQLRGVCLHLDAAQAYGKMSIDVSRIPVDLLTITAHKIHGPQGVGAIYARNTRWLRPLLFGGMQERGFRAGTENLPGIVGFGKAAAVRTASLHSVVSQLESLRDVFESRILNTVPNVSVNGNPTHRVCNTTNLRFDGVDGQALVAQLDAKGIRCSQSSACTNQRPEPSYVLRAMGLTEDEAYSSVRFSFGVFNSDFEIEAVVASIGEICTQLREFASSIRNPYQETKA